MIKPQTLAKTLDQIASDFGLNADDLKAYAAEDEVGGWDGGEGEWPCGSLWSVEGKTIYALVRALRPKKLLELGSFCGASSTHIAEALKKNRAGTLVTVDNLKDGQRAPKQARVNPVIADGVEYVQKSDGPFDLIFEDLMHSLEMSRDVAIEAQAKLTLGGLLIVHDAAHFIVGEDIRAGLAEAGITPKYYLTEPSDCGLAIWQKAAADD